MITKEDIQAAIAECNAVKNPNARTCIKLAAFLTIREFMFEDDSDISGDSVESQPITVSAISQSEFSDAIDGKPQTDVLAIIDSLMDSVRYFNPKLYDATICKIKNL